MANGYQLQKLQWWIIGGMATLLLAMMTILYNSNAARLGRYEERLTAYEKTMDLNGNRLSVIETRVPDMKASVDRIEAKLNILETLVRYRNAVQGP